MKLLIITQKVDINDDILGFFHDWIKEFAKHYEKVTVICLYKGEYDLPDNVKVLSLGKEKGESKLKYLLNFYKYIWQERKNYENVFVHMNPEYIVYGGFIWRLIGKKVGLWFTHKSVNWKLKIAEKLTHTIFTASKESFRLKSNKLKIVGHGIDASKFKSLENKKENRILKLITVGRISPIKDYETLIKAAEILKRDNIEFKLDIIGGPGTREQESYFEKLKIQLQEKKLDDVIKFLGPIPNKDIITYLQSADLFIHMSQTGSLDKAILEAMSCGLVVLSSNDASVDILKSISKDLVFENKNNKELAEKIRKVFVTHAKEREEMGRELREIVKNQHGLSRLIKSILNYQ